jgi:hypothetical protein
VDITHRLVFESYGKANGIRSRALPDAASWDFFNPDMQTFADIGAEFSDSIPQDAVLDLEVLDPAVKHGFCRRMVGIRSHRCLPRAHGSK